MIENKYIELTTDDLPTFKEDIKENSIYYKSEDELDILVNDYCVSVDTIEHFWGIYDGDAEGEHGADLFETIEDNTLFCDGRKIIVCDLPECYIEKELKANLVKFENNMYYFWVGVR